jgi:adenosylhomocysteine nucleosidase
MSDRPVVVLAAMPRELRALARALRLRRASIADLPAWRGEGVVAATVGVGPVRASEGAARVLERLFARRVVITGVAGALDTSLRVGAPVRPAAVVDIRSGAVHTPRSATAGVGVLVTVEQVLVQPCEPSGRPAHTDLPPGAIAVDTESAAIAAACEERGVPWDVVRAISDIPGTLTPEIASLLRPDGRADLARAAALVWHDPRLAGRLVRLGLDTARAVRVATSEVRAELLTPDTE